MAILAVIAAVILSAFQIWAALNFSYEILWQVDFMQWLAGPGPILGYTEGGKPMHEGTPVHMVASYIGVILGFILYAVVIYQLLKWWHNKKINRTKNTGVLPE